MTLSGLTFEIYPLGVAGTPTGLAVTQDDFEKIQLALQDIRGNGKILLPRNHIYASLLNQDKIPFL